MLDARIRTGQVPAERPPRVTGNPLAWALALILLEAGGFLGYGASQADTLLALLLVGHMAVACAIAAVFVLRPGSGEV